ACFLEPEPTSQRLPPATVLRMDCERGRDDVAHERFRSTTTSGGSPGDFLKLLGCQMQMDHVCAGMTILVPLFRFSGNYWDLVCPHRAALTAGHMQPVLLRRDSYRHF